MTAARLLDALELPPASLVNRRVPKTLLVEHGAPTPADRRHVNDFVDTLVWVAALKPAATGAAAVRDDIREYLEIAVLHMTLRDGPEGRSVGPRLTELVHRAVPYPVILLTDHRLAAWAAEDLDDRGDPHGNSDLSISAAHKRWSRGEAGTTVLDDDVTTVSWTSETGGPSGPELAALSLARQPHETMVAVYDGWLSTFTALLAARITGVFSPAGSPEQGTERRAALGEWDGLTVEIDRIRSAAKREKQVARQVELNMQLKALEARRTVTMERLR